MMNRKGLSPIIATILLIALVLVLSGIIFLWARGFVSEQIEKFGSPAQSLCSQADFDADIYDDPSTGAKVIEIVNRANFNVYTIGLNQISGGDSEMTTYDESYGIDSGGALRKEIAIRDGVEKVIVYPVLLGNVKGKTINKQYTCLESGKVVTLN